MRLASIAGLAALLAGPAHAQTAADCAASPPPATDSALPAVDADGARLDLGEVVALRLQAVDTVPWTLPPERDPEPGTHGGLVRFTVVDAGTYEVALADAAWVDLIEGGQRLASVDHRHGPPCSGMRKIVAFDLAPGDHLLQISGAPGPLARVRIARR